MIIINIQPAEIETAKTTFASIIIIITTLHGVVSYLSECKKENNGQAILINKQMTLNETENVKMYVYSSK